MLRRPSAPRRGAAPRGAVRRACALARGRQRPDPGVPREARASTAGRVGGGGGPGERAAVSERAGGEEEKAREDRPAPPPRRVERVEPAHRRIEARTPPREV